MKDWKKVLAGVGLSGVVSVAWELYPDKANFSLKLAASPLAFMEHYHFGLASILIGQHSKKHAYILYGFGAGMIAAEAGHSQPFGFGKVPEQFVPGLALGSALTLLILF